MKLNFKKQIPKIVLAESLACTAILAHGALSKNVALAEETNKILNVYNDSKGEQSEGEKKVDEYLKALQTLYGPSAVGQIGPAEKESLKKISEEIPKEEAERTGLVEKVIGTIKEIKKLESDKKAWASIWEKLPNLKAESLEPCVFGENFDYLKIRVNKLSTEELKLYISVLEEARSVLRGTLGNKGKYNLDPGISYIGSLDKSDNEEIVDIEIKTKCLNNPKEAPYLQYPAYEVTVDSLSKIDELKLESDKEGKTWLTTHIIPNPKYQDLDGCKSGLVDQPYWTKPVEINENTNILMKIKTNIRNLKIMAEKHKASVIVDIKSGVKMDYYSIQGGNVTAIFKGKTSKNAARISGYVQGIKLEENADGSKLANVIETLNKEIIAKSVKVEITDKETGSLKIIPSQILGSLEIEANLKLKDKGTGKESNKRINFVVNNTPSYKIAEIPVQKGIENEISVSGFLYADKVRIVDLHFKGPNDLIVKECADGSKWLATTYAGKEDRVVPVTLDLLINYAGLQYLYKVNVNVTEISSAKKLYVVDDKVDGFILTNNGEKTLISKDVPGRYSNVLGARIPFFESYELNSQDDIVIDMRRGDREEYKVDGYDKRIKTKFHISAGDRTGKIYIYLNPGARVDDLDISGNNVEVKLVDNLGEELNGNIAPDVKVTVVQNGRQGMPIDSLLYDSYYDKLYDSYYDNRLVENMGIIETIDRHVGTLLRPFWYAIARRGAWINGITDEKQLAELTSIWRGMEQASGACAREVVEMYITGKVTEFGLKLGGKLVRAVLEYKKDRAVLKSISLVKNGSTKASKTVSKKVFRNNFEKIKTNGKSSSKDGNGGINLSKTLLSDNRGIEIKQRFILEGDLTIKKLFKEKRPGWIQTRNGFSIYDEFGNCVLRMRPGKVISLTKNLEEGIYEYNFIDGLRICVENAKKGYFPHYFLPKKDFKIRRDNLVIRAITECEQGVMEKIEKWGQGVMEKIEKWGQEVMEDASFRDVVACGLALSLITKGSTRLHDVQEYVNHLIKKFNSGAMRAGVAVDFPNFKYAGDSMDHVYSYFLNESYNNLSDRSVLILPLHAWSCDDKNINTLQDLGMLSSDGKHFLIFQCIEKTGSYFEEDRNEVRNKIKEIIGNLNLTGKSDAEKVMAIYIFMTLNVKYTTDKYYNTGGIHTTTCHSAYGALIEREASDLGFALTFRALCQEAGVHAEVILGLVKYTHPVISRVLDEDTHAWNIVQIGEEYYNVDVPFGRFLQNNEDLGYMRMPIFDSSIFNTLFPMSKRSVRRIYDVDGKILFNDGKFSFNAFKDYSVRSLLE